MASKTLNGCLDIFLAVKNATKLTIEIHNMRRKELNRV